MSLEIQDDDFLELKRLDMVFGLFVAAACLLVLTFFLATYAAIKKSRFLLWVVSKFTKNFTKIQCPYS